MQELAGVLEPIRRALKETGDTLVARGALDSAVGGNKDPKADKALQHLRADFAVLQKQLWVAEVEQALENSPEQAWQLFLNRYVEALSFWRTQLMGWWAASGAGETKENKKQWFKDKTAELRRFKENSRYMEHSRWPEAYPFLRELAVNKLLTPRLRAQLWTVCGSIQMYFNTLPDAEADLAEAEKLFAELPYLPVCRADLERVAGRYEQSREMLYPFISAYPKDAEGPIALGRSFAEEKNWDKALQCYKDAISADPGNAGGYRNMMMLWSKDEDLFKKNKEKIPATIALADRADPESEMSNLLEAGYAYQGGGDIEQAAKCFRKACKAEPDRLEPYTAIGFLYQQDKQYADAREQFLKVVGLGPGSVDGYWYMAGLCHAQEQFTEAAAWFEKALPHCPMFTRTLLVKAGEMYTSAGEFEKAKNSCLKSLELDPDFDYALNTLHDLSDKLRDKGYEDKTGMEPALDILRKIRKIKGEAYEASFQNRAGNIYYYFADYQQAAAHYRNATATDSSHAVYHDNLAGTLDKLADQNASLPDLAEAHRHAEEARRLDPSNENYRQQAARLGRKLTSMQHFGVLPDERSANIFSIRVRFRDELYPWLVKDDNLHPELLQNIEDLREKFKNAFGISLPGVRFSADWNIVDTANFVIDFDGIPMQQGWLDFDGDTIENNFHTLMVWLEQNIQYNLADFIHYDSPEVSARFAGKSAGYASGFFQIIRMLLKQKISVAQIDTIHEIYEAGVRERKSVQRIAQDIRCHPAMLPFLPVNSSASRSFQHLTPEQEEEVLSSVANSNAGQLLWQIRPSDPTFFAILEYLPKTEFALGSSLHFVTTQSPQVATLLNDLHPGTFFSRSEILNLTEAEQSEIPT